MKRRMMSLLLAVLMLISLLPVGGLRAYAATMEYAVTGGRVLFEPQSGFIVGYSGDVTAVTIPEEINGAKVLGIGDGAFQGCYSLMEVRLPEGIQSVGSAAFYECENLKSINLPKSITEIGSGAFYFCRGLTSLQIPEGVKTITPWAFGHCHGLQSVTIPEGVTTIEESAFFSCETLTEVVIPEGVTTIGDAAFSWCRAMTDVTIPAGVITIGDHAFSYCYSLKSADLPEGVTSIGSSAFSYGYDLTNVTIPVSLTKIGATAFEYCGSGMNIYYNGSREQWMAIAQEGNDFSNVTVHFALCNHSYEKNELAPTCTQAGYTTYTCTQCGDTYRDDHADALGHDLAHVAAKEPTCEEAGWEAYETCSRCEYTTYAEKPSLGHAYETVITEPTCTEGGSTVKICSRCKERETVDKTEAYGHAWDEGKVTTEATEESEGVRTYTCTRCGETRTETIPPKDPVHLHSFTETITDPTCTEAGYTTHTCACGESYKDTYTDALKHSYTDGLCIRCGAADPDYEKPGHICPSVGFSDVPAYGNWAHDGIDYCVENGLMNGIGNGRFDPNGTVSRAQLVTILYRVAGSPETEFKGTFTDVPDGQWYSKAIEWAAANGVVNGIGDGKFAPDRSITREQIATILYRYENQPAVSGNLEKFPDQGNVSGFAVTGLIWATQEGLITGVLSNGVTTLAPKNNATRAQIAAIIMRYLEN